MAVTQVTTDRDRDSTRARVTVAARVTNTGRTPHTTDATLSLGGRDVQTKHISVPASGSVQVSFASTAIPTAATRGAVRITHDALAQNDAFYFTLAPDEAVSVLIVEPAHARANQSLFLLRALSIGDRPAFHVDVRSADSLRTADLAQRSLVILNEVEPPAGAVGVQLREMILAGAGLVIAPGALRTEQYHQLASPSSRATQRRSGISSMPRGQPGLAGLWPSGV